MVITAGFSPEGRDFAAHTSDFLFTVFTDIDQAEVTLADIGERAHKVGRELGVISTCHVVCRDTQAEAEDYYHHYGAGMADNEALDTVGDSSRSRRAAPYSTTSASSTSIGCVLPPAVATTEPSNPNLKLIEAIAEITNVSAGWIYSDSSMVNRWVKPFS